MSGKRNLILKMVAFLSLTLMLPSSAEVDHGGLYGTGGRSFSSGLSGGNNLNSVASSCGVGRGAGLAGGGIATGDVTGAVANGQGGANLGDGLIQASVPPGAAVASPSVVSSTLPGATTFMAKCLSCHNPSKPEIPKITLAKAITKVAAGAMPPPPAAALSAKEKADLDAFFKSGITL